MNGLKKLIAKFSSMYDIIIALIGIALFIIVIIIFMNHQNLTVILIACIACGIINILQGLKMMKDPKKRMTGMSYLLLGIVIIVVGFLIVGVR
jgi:4-hydroxybenzoate polyprenyltransferase